MPFAFHFPAQIEEDIEINVPTTFKIDPKNINIDNEIFYYDYSSVNLSDNRIKLTYQFRSKANQVDVAQMPVFIHNVNKFFDEAAGYSLIYNPSLAKPSRFSWMMALIALLVFMLAIYLARKLYFNYDVPSQMNTFMSHKRIEGWLVLVAIGLIFSLVSYIYSLFFQSDYFDAKIIQAIFVQKEVNSEIWSLLVIVEMIIHVLFIVYVGLLIVLFFKRRTVLPGLMIILYISIFVYNLGDHIIAAKVLNQTHVDPKTIFLIAGNFIGAVIWIPYFLYSNRVKNTFVVQIRKASITHTEQSPEADESIGHELISDSNSSAKPLETPVTDENTPVEDSAYDEEVY